MMNRQDLIERAIEYENTIECLKERIENYDKDQANIIQRARVVASQESEIIRLQNEVEWLRSVIKGDTKAVENNE